MKRNRFTQLVLFSVIVVAVSIMFMSLVSAETNTPTANDMIITGVVDATLSGGTPKAVEVCVINPIPDLSIYGLGSANNDGGSDGEEFTFPAVSASAGDFIYIASESPQFNVWFGFTPDYVDSMANINGDDSIELFENGVVVDTFGVVGVDGTGEPWDHVDGWAYRIAGGIGTFTLADWSFSGPNALDGEADNATAATPFPLGDFACASTAVTLSEMQSSAETSSYAALAFATFLLITTAGWISTRKQ